MSEEQKDLGDKAKEFAEEAKKEAQEFSNDAKETFKDGKSVAIIAHITLIGWVIALIMNNGNRTEIGSFYVRQVLGIIIVGLLGFIPLLGIVFGLLSLVLWIMSLINAIGGSNKPVFLLGDKFQEWFKGV